MHSKLWLRLVLVVIVACMMPTIWQPMPADAARKKILNFAAKEPEHMDPHATILGQGQAIVRFIYRGLTRFAIKDGKVTTADLSYARVCSFTMTLVSLRRRT
jgi:ABC-type oligopeptide transport system substrate-binding subunit